MAEKIDVSHSLMNARWVLPKIDMDITERISRKYGLSEFISQLIVNRDIAEESIDSFLNPTLSKDFPDPFLLKDMDQLSVYLADAIAHEKKIAVFGDFDVDGACSTALFVRFFRHLGLDVPYYIPDRLKEGYGPNINAFKALKEKGADIILICDCGITAYEPIEEGRNLGLDLVVIDHHEAEETLPKANYVINPKRKDDNSNLDVLAACGVVFLVCVALNSELRKRNYFKQKQISEVPLKSWLDILALGTVCDMVPLLGPNRLFVKYGFDQMNQRQNPGILALANVAKLEGEFNTYHAGFILGPRINAGSRVHKADLGATLLSSDDYELAHNIAHTLNDCNEKRKDIEYSMFNEAVSLVESNQLDDNPIIIVDSENWHPGLSGLVAGRLKEKYGKPACVITYAKAENGILEGRGSGRSIPSVNMGAAFIDARNEGLIVKGGGHAMAAGFTLTKDQIKEFSDYLYKHVNDQLGGKIPLTETLIDSIISVRGAKTEFVKLMHEQFGPFGQEHTEPLFLLPQVKVYDVGIVGKDHVKCHISDWEGGTRLKGVAFRSSEMPLGQALLSSKNEPLHLLGHLKVNKWNGYENVELHIIDAAYAIPSNNEIQQEAI